MIDIYWKDLIWPWGALKREKAARWALVGECVDARRDAARERDAYNELADEYEKLSRDCNVLRGRIDGYENALRGVARRDPVTGQFVKRDVVR